MKVLVAGSTGALGLPVTRALSTAGHEVVGLTRYPEKAETIRAAGAEPVFADVLDADSIAAVVQSVRPEAIVQLLNALPKRGPTKVEHLAGTNLLRTRGTANLLAAARGTGVRRFVVESLILGYGYGSLDGPPISEEREFARSAPLPGVSEALGALVSLEDQVQEATDRGDVEGIRLRFGLFYGPDAGSTRFLAKILRKGFLPLPGGGRNVMSFIHLEDGAAAVVKALDDAAPGSVYNVVDDEPVSLRDYLNEMARVLETRPPWSVPLWTARLAGDYARLAYTTNIPVSNVAAKRELGWRLRYPTYREGLVTLAEGQMRATRLKRV